MADAPHHPRGNEPSESTERAAPRERIRRRAERWARLCRELSDHADELRNLRKELAPHEPPASSVGSDDARRRHEELAQREVRLQREAQVLQRERREFELQRRQFAARQRTREESANHVCDRRLLQAARFEYEARRRLAEAAALADEVGRFEAALDEMTHEIERELGRFESDDRPSASAAEPAASPDHA